MSKKFKSQASSARAASAAFGSPSFGFGNATTAFQTSNSLLSYVTELPDLSGISQPTLVVAFKNLSKKDSVTKEKALDELNEYLSANATSKDFVLEDAIIGAWINIYPRTSIDNSRRVRQLAQVFQGSLTALGGKRIAPHLPKIIGPWLAGTFDNDNSVSRAATGALQKSFASPEKRTSLWSLYQKALIEYIEDATTIQTPQSLSDERTVTPDDAEAKYIRVVGTGLSLLTTLISQTRESLSEKSTGELNALLTSGKLWEHAYYSDAFVRRSTYALLITCLSRMSNIVNAKLISSCFLDKALHANQLGSTGSFSEALLAITRSHPEAWTAEYSSKSPAHKRLLRFVRQGSQRGPASFWHTMSHLIEMIPKDVWNAAGSGDASTNGNIQPQIATSILEAFHGGVTNTEEPRQNLTAAWDAYMDIGIWLSEQLSSTESRESLLNDKIFKTVEQHITNDPDMSQWNILTPSATGILARVLDVVASKFGATTLKACWVSTTDKVLEAVMTSQPESSSSFKGSQDQVAARGRRYFELQAKVLGDCTSDLQQAMASNVFVPSNLYLSEECQRILKNRIGKPYGAASLIRDAFTIFWPSMPQGSKESAYQDLLDFLDDNLLALIESPSAGILLALLLKLRQNPTIAANAEHIIGDLLSQDTVDTSSPAFQSLVLSMSEEDMRQYPRVKETLLRQLDNGMHGRGESWQVISLMLHRQNAVPDLTEQILSQMLDGLSIDDTTNNVLTGFTAIIGDSKASIEQTIGADNTSTLLSKLFVLEETTDGETSTQAHQLAQLIKANLDKAGLASKSTADIVRRQLYLTGEDAIAIHTLVDITKGAYANKSTSQSEAFVDIFPIREAWESAISPFLDSCPARAAAVTSILQGAASMVKSTDAETAVPHDIDGLSIAVRLAIFTIQMAKSTDILDVVSSSSREAFFVYLPLVLQTVNEKLDISRANDCWDIESQEMDDEMSQLITDGRQLIALLLEKRHAKDALDALAADETTFETVWLTHLQSITDRSPRSYRFAVAFAEVMSVAVDNAGSTRYSRVWAPNLSNVRKSTNVFCSAALVAVCKSGLIPGNKLCTELVVDLTNMNHEDDSLPGFGATVLLNLLVGGQDELLASLPTQRLVYLVKAIVNNIIETNQYTSEYFGELLKLLSAILPSVSTIYDDFWESLWNNVQATFAREWITPSAVAQLHSTLRLYTVYDRLARALTNDDLVDLWAVRVPKLPESFMGILKQYNENFHVDHDASISGDITPDVLESRRGRNRPRTITMSLLNRAMAGMPVKELEAIDATYAILSSEDREVQSTIFDILHQRITDDQEQMSVEVALSKEVAHLPDELLSLLLDAPSMETISFSSELYELVWAAPRRYLMAWKLIFDHFTKASHRLREMYAEDIKNSGHLESLLKFNNELLRISSTKPVDTSAFEVDDLDFYFAKSEPQQLEAQALAAHLYYLCLLYLPNLTRTWWFESKNNVKGPLETWTQKHITPKLSRAVLRSVSDWLATLDTSSDDGHSLELKISPTVSELIASIPVDPESAPISLMIALPPAFPLEQAVVTSRNRVAVSAKNWESWLRTIRGIIMFSNGSIIDGLLAFRRNVQGALKGHTECAICYSIIGTDMKTPDKKCATCKNMFHSTCLYRWFRSSNSSSCPLCRNNFNYA